MFKESDVGIINVLFSSRLVFLQYLAAFLGMYSINYWTSFLTLHLNKNYDVPGSQVGYYFAILTTTNMFTNIMLPHVLKPVPPKLQVAVSYVFIVLALGLLGPSHYLGLTQDITYISIGLGLSGIVCVPSFIQCMPEVMADMQYEYYMVEGLNCKLDGLLSDTQSCIYSFMYSGAAMIAPLCGGYMFDIIGYRSTNDVHMFSFIVITAMQFVFLSGPAPYKYIERRQARRDLLKQQISNQKKKGCSPIKNSTS